MTYNSQSKLFCLEAVPNVQASSVSRLFPMLEYLALEQELTNVYQSCDSIEGLEQSLGNLLYEDANFKHYEILYLVFPGSGENIILGGYRYAVAEIAELFEGKLKNKLVHFANSKTLDIDLESAQYFLDVSGAKALSGYNKSVPIPSDKADAKLFTLFQEIADMRELALELVTEFPAAKALGFQLYY